MTLTQARLKELLHYDPETGQFTWLVSRGRSRFGAIAGSHDRHGYYQLRIDSRTYRAHRLAFLYVTGGFPPADVDHINQVKDDNRWENLRPATRSENKANTPRQPNSSSGYRGVSWRSKSRKWLAHGTRGGRQVYLGLFSSVEDAAEAAQKWRESVFGTYAAKAGTCGLPHDRH